MRNNSSILLRRYQDIEHVPQIELRSYIQNSSIVILPSFAEAFPMSWLEAMAMEKACITTPLANNALKAPKSSIIVGKTSRELAQHCIDLIKNESIRNKCAREGRKFVEKTYKWTETSERLNQLFHRY